MGRFSSTVEFYTLYREPYSPEFFRAVAERLGLHGDEALLDVGCGPAPLAIGFAPFVAGCTGLDPEPGMIEAAKAAAEQAGTHLTLRLGRIEDFTAGELFDVVTIGRALHWLDRRSALDVLERIVSKQGHILVCRRDYHRDSRNSVAQALQGDLPHLVRGPGAATLSTGA